MISTIEIMKRAVTAKENMRSAKDRVNAALLNIADALIKNTDIILEANEKDCREAEAKLGAVMIDRLRLTDGRIRAMAEGIRQIAALPCPIGITLEEKKRPNGLVIKKVSVPLGVIAIIYESRPNVTSDAAALALKSGNVCILRSGKEAYRSSRAIVDVMAKTACASGLPEYAIQLVEDTTRAGAAELMRGRGYIDLLIPRGGAGLIRSCVENALVPCLETGTGICHIYVDKDAELEKALNILDNAKTSRPSVCNAAEVLLIHRDIARKFLPMVKKRLVDDRISAGLTPVELITDPESEKIIGGTAATPDSFDTEYLDYRLAVGVVGSFDEAVSHINTHSTKHSEAIITECDSTAEHFLASVDSAAVYHNASTRFTDGGEFGLGCEMGISTQKMHARGPVGIKELTTYKYIIKGNGQIR